MTTRRSATPTVKALLAALGILVPILVSQQIPASITYPVGELDQLSNIDGLYEPEIGPNGWFRWTRDVVGIQLQPLGYPLHVTFHVQGVRPEGADPAQVRATSNNRDLGLQVLSQEPATLTYRLPLATISQINPNITLIPTTFQPPGDARNLGIVLYSIEERNAPGPWPSIPAIWVAVPLLLGGLFAYLIGAVGFQKSSWGVLGVWSWGFAIGLLNAIARPWLVFYSWYLVIPPLALLAFLLTRRDIRSRRLTLDKEPTTDPVVTGAKIGAARAIAAFLVVASLLLLGWHLLAPNEPPGYDPRHNVTWGVSSFNKLPDLFQFAGILVVVGAIGWAFLAPIRRRSSKTAFLDPDSWPNMLWRLLPLALVLIGMMLFTIFPVSYSEGDSALWGRINPRNRVFESQPLDTYLKVRLFRTFLLPSFKNAFEVVAVLAGGLYIAGAFVLSSTLGRNRKEALVLLAGLLSVGNFVFFFRYVETYALMTAGSVWLIWACWRYVSGTLAFTVLAAVTAIAVLSHAATTWETPMVGAALLLGSAYLHGRERIREYLRNISYGAIVGLAIFSIFAGVMVLDGYTLATFLTSSPGVGGADRSMFVPLSLSGTSSYEYYTFLSPNHIGAIIQEQLLTTPMALLTLLAVFLFAWKDALKIASMKPAVIALATGAASTLIFATLWNPDLGARIDWDLMALPAVTLTTLALYLLLQLPDGKPKRLAISAYLSLSAIHMLGWLLTHTLHIGF